MEAGSAAPWGACLCLLAALPAGAAGALLGEAIVRRLPLLPGALEAARARIVVSETVHLGYPKAAEQLYLAVGFASTALFALLGAVLAALVLGARSPRAAAAELAGAERPVGSLRGFELGVLLAVLAVGAWPATLATPWAPWRVFAEEGVHGIAGITIALGGRLFADVDYTYGPLLALPSAAAFALAEPSVHVLRLVALALHGAGLALTLAVARPLFRTRAGWVLFAVLLLWLVPLPYPRLHLTAWRNTVGFAPLLFLPAARAGHRFGWPAAGAAAAFAVFTTPEVATAALLAPGAVALFGPGPAGRLRAAIGFAGGLALGVIVLAVAVLPVADPIAFAEDAFRTLRAVSLGFLNRIFPTPFGAGRLWLSGSYGPAAELWRYAVQWNAVIAVTAAFAVVIAFRAVRRALDAREWMLVAVAIAATALLPKLVTRPGPDQLAKVLPGLLVVGAALAEDAVRGALRRRRLPDLVAAGAALAPILVLAWSVSFAIRPLAWPARPPVLDPGLGPIFVDPELAGLVRDVRTEVDRRLPPGAGLWAYPNAPGWNLVLGRPPAHPLSVVLGLRDAPYRDAALRALAARPPRLVIRHPMVSELEGIPIGEIAAPIDAFLAAHYRVAATVARGPYAVDLLEPIAPTSDPASAPGSSRSSRKNAESSARPARPDLR
jgi:hypothetical protein